MNKDLLSLIGLAYAAKKIVTGEEFVIEKIRQNQVKFLFIAKDASEKSKKKLIDKATFYKVEYNLDFSSEELSKAIGKQNRMSIGILDKGFTKLIKEKVI